MVRKHCRHSIWKAQGTQRVSFTHGDRIRDEDRILPSVQRGKEQRLESTKARVQERESL